MSLPSLPQDRGHDKIHLPPPSYWPAILAFSLGLVPLGLLLAMWGGKAAVMVLTVGGLATVIGMMGWANSVIRETAALPNRAEDEKWLRMGLLLFLISETAIFGTLFVHHYQSRAHFPEWPPAGAPILDTTLPAIATLLLMASSATMQWAHAALVRERRRAANWWTLATILLGTVFLGFQGHEWGFLKTYDQFTQKSGTYGTSFYSMTGFHGLHVMVGLVMLILVWFRLRLGHFDPERHFSFIAAAWYWHFVDFVWVLLFFTVYLF